MPLVKTKTKARQKAGKSAGLLVAKGHVNKSTKTSKKKTSPPSIDSGYSLYSTDSEDPVVYANRGLDRCAALLANILESDDSERKVNTFKKPPRKGKPNTKTTSKATVRKPPPPLNHDRKEKSKLKMHTFKVPTATQDLDVSLSESPSKSSKSSINLSTRSRPMSPFKPEHDYDSSTKEAPYNERLPSSTPITTPPTLIQAEAERQQLREKLHQSNLPVGQRPEAFQHPEHGYTNNEYPPLESHLLQDYQKQIITQQWPSLPTSRDDNSLLRGAHLINQWLEDDPRGYHSEPLAYSNGANQNIAANTLANRNPSFDQVYYHSNPNYGGMYPERENAVEYSPEQHYPLPVRFSNYFPYSENAWVHGYFPPRREQFVEHTDNVGEPAKLDLHVQNYGQPEKRFLDSIPVSDRPADVNYIAQCGTSTITPSTGSETTRSKTTSGTETDGCLPDTCSGTCTASVSDGITSSSVTAPTTSTVPSTVVTIPESDLPRKNSVDTSDITINTDTQPRTEMPKPISPFRPSSSSDRSRSNSLALSSQSEQENKAHFSKPANENAAITRTPAKTPPLHNEDQSHRRKSNPMHTVRYLLGELRAVNSIHGDIEVNRLLDEIEHTVHALPHVRETFHLETEIALALQPLRSENSHLRRRLRILNQQLRDRERTEKENTQGTLTFEFLAAQTLSVTLQKQLDDEKRLREKLQNRFEELKQELRSLQEERKTMLIVLDEKDNSNLKSREEWTMEKAMMKNNLEQTLSKAEAIQLKTEASLKENDILKLTLKQRDAEVERLRDLNESLQQSVSNLLHDLETHKPALSNRGEYYSVPQVSMQRLERLLRPNQPTKDHTRPVQVERAETNGTTRLRGLLSDAATVERSEVNGRTRGHPDAATVERSKIIVPSTNLSRRDVNRTSPHTPTQKTKEFSETKKSPAQRVLNFGVSPERKRPTTNFQSVHQVNEDNSLAETFTDGNGERNNSHNTNGSDDNWGYRGHGNHDRRKPSPESTLTKENLEEHNKSFPIENKEDYRLSMLTRSEPNLSGKIPPTSPGKYASTLSSGTLTPTRSTTLTPGRSAEPSPVKGEGKAVTFAKHAHEEYYYDPKSRIHSTSKSTLTDKSLDQSPQTQDEYQYEPEPDAKDKHHIAQYTSISSGDQDLITRPKIMSHFLEDEFEMYPEPKPRFGSRHNNWEKNGGLVDEIGSVISGSTLSSITSQDERQFRQGLANLDADIARLQSNLKQFKHSK